MAWGWLTIALVAGGWLSSWPSAAYSQTQAPSQHCAYDDSTSTFHFSPDRKMTLIFGLHGIPSYIDKYVRGGNPQDVKRVRELIKGHEESLPAMLGVFESSLKQFRNNPPNWISYENNQQELDRIGGFNGLMQFLKSEDLRMQKLGLSQEERKSYLIIMTDPVIAAQYWMRNKEGKSDTPPPVLYGFDNARTVGQTEAKDEMRRVIREYHAMVQELDDPKYDVPEWFIKSYWSKSMTTLLYDKPQDAVTHLRTLINDPRFKKIPSLTRNKLISLRDYLANHAPSLQKTIDEDAVEFARRDREIARDLFNTHNGSQGTGLAHIGAAHKPGVVERLQATCRNLGGTSPAKPADTRQRSPTVK